MVGVVALVSGLALLLGVGDTSVRIFLVTFLFAFGLVALGGIFYGLGRLIVEWSDKAAAVRSTRRLNEETPELFPDPPSARDERLVQLGRIAGWVGGAVVLLVLAGFVSCVVGG